MVSIIIAAHNEANVLGHSLDAVLTGTRARPLEVIVVPNGCTDDTAEVARAREGVQIVELQQGCKPAALNAGDGVAKSFPRIYLDADIVVPPGGVERLLNGLTSTTPVAVPKRRLALNGRPWAVRAYYAINESLPVFESGLFGRGMIALSEDGRSRFGEFPSLVADDMFLDAHFDDNEKAQVAEVEVVIEAPFTTRDLVRRLIRVRRGLAAIRAAGRDGRIDVRIRETRRWSWLRDVVLRQPRLIPAGFAYAAITIAASALARRGSVSNMDWGRDESTRQPRTASEQDSQEPASATRMPRGSHGTGLREDPR